MSLAISTSGLDVNQFRMNSTAHNIANANTENFHSQQVVSSENVSEKNTASGTSVNEVKKSSQTGVNLSSELTDMKKDEVVYKANAKAVQVQNKTMGSLLDTVA